MSSNNLYEYGISKELSSIRIHVCPVANCVFVFTREGALKAIEDGCVTRMPVFVDGRQTADGWLIPPTSLPWKRGFQIPDMMKRFKLHYNMKPAQKGKAALNVVKWMVESDEIDFFGIDQFKEVDILPLQYIGVDCALGWSGKRAQWWAEVKMDFAGGPRSAGGTGNFYVQTHERNYNKEY